MAELTGHCVVDGQLLPSDRASISVADDGLLRGDGVFEVVRVYGGHPFALGDHLRRLARSAEALRLAADVTTVREDISKALQLVTGRDALLRVVITRGGRRLVLAEDLPQARSGVRVAVLPHCPHPLLREAKSLSYAANMLAARIAQERGFDDALLVNTEREVLELTRSAVFWVAGGQVFAPPLDVGILDSITRRRILGLVEVRERRCSVDELGNADEVFMADTVNEILPIYEVEGVAQFSRDAPRTAEVRHLLRDLVEREVSEGL